ncbi:MAG: NUDIX hydrolase [Ardenticatenaceae bacterium]
MSKQEHKSASSDQELQKKYYETGGGVVINQRGEVLLLERYMPREEGLRHEVRLPKGHIEANETVEQAALREVCEESGYCDLQIITSLGSHTTTFQFRDALITRLEYYFLMRLRRDENSGTQFDPDSEEQLFKVRWATNFEEAEQLLTYPSEKLFAQRARNHFRD